MAESPTPPQSGAGEAKRRGRLRRADGPMGPLGPGHAPENDPMKGLRGVMAGTLVLESIVILLVLTVVTRVDGGAAATPLKLGFVIALGIAMLVAAFIQRLPFAHAINIGLQVLAVAGFFVHPTMGVMGIIFAAVWWYIYHLRGILLARMRRGLLPSQHV